LRKDYGERGKGLIGNFLGIRKQNHKKVRAELLYEVRRSLSVKRGAEQQARRRTGIERRGARRRMVSGQTSGSELATKDHLRRKPDERKGERGLRMRGRSSVEKENEKIEEN